jgi:hypothetical protein
MKSLQPLLFFVGIVGLAVIVFYFLLVLVGKSQIDVSPVGTDVECVNLHTSYGVTWRACDMPDGARCIVGSSAGMMSCYMPEGLSK